MNASRRLNVAAAAAIALSAHAQPSTAPYNEAVHFVNGNRVVDVAPVPDHMKGVIAVLARPDQHPPLMSFVQVVETPMGLMDCNGTWWYHEHACSPSTFGTQRIGRRWTVEMHGQWFGCIGRERPLACVPLIADGKLRPLPTPLQE